MSVCNVDVLSTVSKTAGWIKMPLGDEVGLGQGDIVLDGDQVPSKGAQQPPHALLGPCLLWPNGRPSQQTELFMS